MPSFLTQCPHCLTSFRVTDAQLEAAEGLVRCGACLGIFSAAANRITLKQTPGERAAFAPDGIEEEEETEEFEHDAEEEIEDDAEEEIEDDAEEEYDDGDDEQEFDADDEELAAESAPGVVELLAIEAPFPHPDTDESESPAVASHADADLLDSDDLEVSLGDFNLDGHEELEADDDYEVDDEEEDEEEEDEEEDFEDDPDTDEESEDEDDATDAVYEEYADDEPRGGTAEEVEEDAPPEEFEPEFHFDDEDEDYIDAAGAVESAQSAPEFAEYDEVPAPVPQRVTGERITADKSDLRRYLAEIEDDEALGVIDDDDALAAIDEPVMLHTAPRRSWLVGFALLVANVLLAGLLLLQYADANIDALSRNPRFAPMLPYVCRMLECPAPDRSQLRLLVSEQVLVRSHPRLAEALEVNLVFRNDATVAQPFPALELGFSDTSNRLLANRLFKPAEYLPPELRTSEMPAQSSLQVTLELADPGSEAVNYTLAFRAPE